MMNRFAGYLHSAYLNGNEFYSKQCHLSVITETYSPTPLDSHLLTVHV